MQKLMIKKKDKYHVSNGDSTLLGWVVLKYNIIMEDKYYVCLAFQFLMVHSSQISWLDNFQYFEGYLYLIHQWGDACSFPNKMSVNVRLPVAYILDEDMWWLLNIIDLFNNLIDFPRSLIIVFFSIIPLSFLHNMQPTGYILLRLLQLFMMYNICMGNRNDPCQWSQSTVISILLI